MMNTVTKTKKLLVCMLAAAMSASAFAGGLLLDASAAELQVESAALFTTSQGVNALPASQYERPDGTKSEVGLRFQSQNDEAFTIDLNGVFHRSFGLDWAAPADGWVSGGAEVVFEIAEFGNPDNKFEIHYKGLYQSSAWVQYDYTNAEGQSETLYRTYGLGYQGTSRMVYSKDIIDGSVNSPDGSDILFYPELTATTNGSAEDRRYSRTEVRVQKSLTDGTAASMADDGAIVNVVGFSKGGGVVPIASFRDDPGSFSPTDEAMEVYAKQQWWDPSGDANYKIGYNLPRINFDNGYTVKIHVSAGLEFMVFSIGEIMDNDYDNYWTNEPFNTWPAMQVDTRGEQAQCADEANAATYWSTVSFYQNWLTAPSVKVSEYENIVAAGEAITPPAATYATNGEPTASNPVTDIDYRVNGGGWSDVPEEGIPACKTGDEVDVRYNALSGGISAAEIITLSVREMTELSAKDVVRVADPSVTVTANKKAVSNNEQTTSGEAGLLLESGVEEAYSFDLVGRFTGNTELRWGTAAEEDWGVNGSVEFIVAEAGNPGNYFKVVWVAPWQSAAYVEYVHDGETLYCARDLWGGDTFYYTYADVTDGNKSQARPFVGDASSVGILGLRWSGDVLNVVVHSGKYDNTELVLASFSNDLEGFQPITEGSGDKSNLPKISFENGYTVSVKVTGAIDFLLYDVTTAADASSFDAESFSYEPVWYTRGAAMPVFEDIPVLAGVQTGSDTKVTVPELTYTAGEDAQLTVTWVKPADGGEQQVNVSDELSMTEQGDHILRYTVTVDGVAYTKEVTVHVCDYTEFVSGTHATCTTAGEGMFQCEHGNSLEKVIPIDETAHSAVYHKEVPATCTTEGTKEYWECNYCHKKFTSEDCTEEAADLTIEKTAHNYTAEWTWDGETATLTLTCGDCSDTQTVTEGIEVKEVVEKGVPSTCKEQGKKVVTASVTYQEEVYTSEEHEIALPLAAHTIKEVAAKAPTCTEAGNKAHWTCSVCGKLFSDAEGKTETTLEAVTVPAKGHSYGTPTWVWADDYSTATATFTCKENDDTQTVKAEGSAIKAEETPASCTEAGERTYTATVTFGGETYTDVKKETIPAGHQLEAVAAKEPTCTEAGNKAHWTCSVCDKLFADAEGKTETTLKDVTVPAKGHQMEQVAAKAPTCTEDGNSSYYKCSECGRCTSDSKGEMEIDEASMVLKAKGHTFEEGKCTVCGAEDPDFVPETGLTGGEIAAIVISSVVAAGAVVALVIILRKVKFKTKK